MPPAEILACELVRGSIDSAMLVLVSWLLSFVELAYDLGIAFLLKHKTNVI